MVRNSSNARQEGREARSSRILALVLAFALAIVGSSAVVLPATATQANAAETTAAQDAKQQATITVIGQDAQGNRTYFLAPTAVNVTANKNGWDFVKDAFKQSGIKYDATEGTAYGTLLNSITDPTTGKVVANDTGDYTSPDYKSWTLYVNGEVSNVGISSVTVKPGDTITWYFTHTDFDTKTNTTVAPAVPVAMYRLYNPYSGEHLFTESKDEVDNLTPLGWKDEGTAWQAAEKSSTAVYRLYNPYNGEHLYTTKKAEYDQLQTIGWSGEGIKAYSDDAKGVSVYRLYNPYVEVGTHLYTTDKAEYDNLQTLGWKGEDVSLYGVK